MFTICQHLYTFGVEVWFTRIGKIVEGVWLWRISGGYSQEMMGLVLTITSIYFPNKT